MLTLQVERPQWSWTNHLELPMSWFSKTHFTKYVLAYVTPNQTAKTMSLNFHMEALPLSLGPWPGC